MCPADSNLSGEPHSPFDYFRLPEDATGLRPDLTFFTDRNRRARHVDGVKTLPRPMPEALAVRGRSQPDAPRPILKGPPLPGCISYSSYSPSH
jgi:hypothetical protein